MAFFIWNTEKGKRIKRKKFSIEQRKVNRLRLIQLKSMGKFHEGAAYILILNLKKWGGEARAIVQWVGHLPST